MASIKEGLLCDDLEQIFITHCGPVLFSSKPSALFIVRTEQCYSCLLDIIIQMDAKISLIILKKIQKGFLVFLYKPDALYGVIAEPDTHKLLGSFGYNIPGFNSLKSYLAVLQSRFLESDEFPHEIGFFLGYPTDDVVGFIQQKGKNYKYCGLWKVYGDVKKALTLFQQYETCRKKTKRYFNMYKLSFNKIIRYPANNNF
jgi:hypothetical protein